MNALPELSPTGDDDANNVTSIRRATEKLNAVVGEATRPFQPPPQDPNAAMEDLRIPDDLLAVLFRHASELGLVVDSAQMEDRYGSDIVLPVTVVRCHGRELYLVNVPGFVLDNPTRENRSAVGLLESMFPPGAVISIISRDLPPGPHKSYFTMWKAWESKSAIKVFFIPWRDLNDLARHEYRASDVAETLHLTEIATPSSDDAKAAELALPRALRIFISYAPQDDHFRGKLIAHLSSLKREGLVALWTDRDIAAGDDRETAIDENLEEADVILLLVSQDFIDSDYIQSKELKRALARHQADEALVVPIIVRPADWENAPFARFQAIPTDATPVTKWPDLDEAWVDVVKSLRALIEKLVAARS
jgi:TIR domain